MAYVVIIIINYTKFPCFFWRVRYLLINMQPLTEPVKNLMSVNKNLAFGTIIFINHTLKVDFLSKIVI